MKIRDVEPWFIGLVIYLVIIAAIGIIGVTINNKAFIGTAAGAIGTLGIISFAVMIYIDYDTLRKCVKESRIKK